MHQAAWLHTARLGLSSLYFVLFILFFHFSLFLSLVRFSLIKYSVFFYVLCVFVLVSFYVLLNMLFIYEFIPLSGTALGPFRICRPAQPLVLSVCLLARGSIKRHGLLEMEGLRGSLEL